LKSWFKRPLTWIALALVAALIWLAAAYRADMNRAYARVRSNGTVIASPYGDIEYTSGGSGTPVLVIHGSGGGYDQGELMVRAVLGERFQWVAPSRFGYLGSALREGATFDDQAHAYAYLLDQLGIKKVAVVALSHGGPSALLFAVLHPERVSSLSLISAGVAASTDPKQSQANQKGDMLKAIFQHDFLYWTISRVFRTQLMELMGANTKVIASLTQPQRDLVDQIIDYMNPVAPRSAGTVFDNLAAMPNERIAAIRAPTLVFHAADDGLQLYRNAEYAAAHIPGAQLVRFERGGHLVICIEQGAIRAMTQKHVVENTVE
jgi:2-hydroxy-6-oxonona-2,4-dienedioate hydrolase